MSLIKGIPVSPYGRFGDLQRLTRSDPMVFLPSLRKKLGDVHYARPISPMLMVYGPEALEILWDLERSSKSDLDSYTALRAQLGPSVITEGDPAAWQERKKALRSVFYPEGTRQSSQFYQTVMQTRADQLIQGWLSNTGTPIDPLVDMQRLTLQIIVDAMFGPNAPESIWAIPRNVQDIMQAVLVQVFLGQKAANLLLGRKMRKSNAAADSAVEEMLEIAKTRIDEPYMVNLMLQLVQKGVFTHQDLLAEVKTVLSAGYETTAGVASWMLVYMAKNPQYQDYVRGSDDQAEAFVREVLRYYPTAALIERKLLKDEVIGGYEIPEGARVSFFLPGYTHDDGVFSNAGEFNPDRWINPAGTTKRSWARLNTFGGIQHCLGRDFAFTELLVLAKSIAENVQLYSETAQMPESRLRVVMSINPKDANRFVLAQKSKR